MFVSCIYFNQKSNPNPGYVPWLELNLWTFGARDDGSTNEPHQPGLAHKSEVKSMVFETLQ